MTQLGLREAKDKVPLPGPSGTLHGPCLDGPCLAWMDGPWMDPSPDGLPGPALPGPACWIDDAADADGPALDTVTKGA